MPRARQARPKRQTMAEPRRKQAARQLRPEYLSAIARERERISALQTGDRSRLPLDSPRVQLWRWQLMTELPEGLLDRLFEAARKRKRPTSTKELAHIALALRRGL